MEYLRLDEGLERRVFIKGIGFVSLGLLLGTTLGGCECLVEQIQNRPTRRRLRSGSAEVDADIAIYEQAVSLMAALPAGDPRSWSAQAAIHGTVLGGFNLCQHGTDHFFSWHRAYLFYFEKICQKLTGKTDFGLPYWNWNQDPAINPAFTASMSSLFHARSSTTVAGNSAVSGSTLDTIFSDANFFTFGSQLEGTPHNTVHGVVGGDMSTGGSAQDPVFWAHHCMIDYCWAKWNIELGNDNTNDATWVGTSWDHFVDADGDPATVTAGITTLMPLLSYQYESSAIGSSAAMALAAADFEKLKMRIEKGADIRFDIRRRISIAEAADVLIERPFSTETKVTAADFSALIEAESSKENIFASVDYAQLPATSDFFVRVFINMSSASAQTPTTDPHYAGSFAFFGTHMENHPGHEHAPRFLVNVTNTLRELRRRNELSQDSPLSVQLVAVPFTGRFERKDATLRLRKVEFLVTPVVIHGN